MSRRALCDWGRLTLGFLALALLVLLFWLVLIFTIPVSVRAADIPLSPLNPGVGDAQVKAADLATIQGVVFDDVNGNGVQDGGEADIPGVALACPGAITSTVVTSDYGQYVCLYDVPGRYTVIEADPPGYQSFAPNLTTVPAVALGQSYQVDFGDSESPGAPGSAVVYGAVWKDLDGDGAQGSTEAGIPGVTVAMSGVVTSTTTSDSGHYAFVDAPFGSATVSETNLSGYISTTSDNVTVTVEAGQVYQVDFGDVPVLSGVVYEDLDGDGVRDAGEVGIPGVLITLIITPDRAITIATTLDGMYAFTTTVTGTHTIAEIDPDGYFSTTPNTVTLNVDPARSFRVEFGDALASSGLMGIYGTVFEDANGNGVQDVGEMGIPSVTITIDGNDAVSTGPYGGYTFSTTVTGSHTAVETEPDGYFSTTPNSVTLSVAAGNSYQVDFGDVLTNSGFAIIYGTIWEDVDEDGLREHGEMGLPQVTVSCPGAVVPMIRTGAYGHYVFRLDAADLYTVTETDPDGYYATTPNVVTRNVEPGRSYRVDFGMMGCVCSADGYEEDDDKDQADGQTLLTPGVRQQRNFCEDVIDWTRFAAKANGVYTVTTSSWGWRANVFLVLYDTDGTTSLTTSDDHGTLYFSHIVWRAPADGVYYVRATNRSGLIGCHTEYELLIAGQEPRTLYLPVLMRSRRVR